MASADHTDPMITLLTSVVDPNMLNLDPDPEL